MTTTCSSKVFYAAALLVLPPIQPASAQTLLCTIDAVVTGSFSGACGNLSVVNGNYDFASGYLSKITGNNSAAYGAYSFAGGDNAVAIGARSTAANASPYTGTSNATAVGAYSTAGTGGAAVGAYATATGMDAIAYGHSATADQSLAMAIGFSAQARAANAVAVGPNASATASGAVAIGSGSVADVANTVSVGATGSERKIVNLANGALSASSKDAVNGGQLFATNNNVTANTASIGTLSTGLANTNAALVTANTNFATANSRVAAAFGGGSTVDINGIVTAPGYSLFGTTYTNVGSALGAVEARTNTNTTDISNLSTQINSGGTGLLRQDATTRTLSVGALTDGTVIDATGTAGARKLTGLQAGVLSNTSADAVTGAQLNATNSNVTANTASIGTLSTGLANTNAALVTANTNFATANSRVAAAFGGGSTVDINGIVTAPGYSLFGTTYTNVGSALGAVEARTNTNTTDISSIWSQLGQGSVGLIRQDATTRDLSIGAQTDGASIDISGTSGARKLTGLRSATLATNSSDAVTGSQLYDANNAIASAASGITALTSSLNTLGTNFGTSQQRIAAAFGGGSATDANGLVTAPSYSILGANYSNVGSALSALNTRVQTNSNNIGNLMAAPGGSGGGGGSLVSQDPFTRTILVAPTTDGTTLDVSGLTGTRTITGVASGSIAANSRDAINGAQLASTNAAVATAASYSINAANGLATTIGGGSVVDGAGNVVASQFTVQSQTFNNVGAAITAIDAKIGVVGTDISNISNTMSNITSTTRYLSINGRGRSASASGTEAIALGTQSTASADNAVALGANALASATGAIALGSAAAATGVNAIAIGVNAVATGSVALGVNAVASNGGAALGDNAISTGADSAAVGPKATALAPNAVAIGSGSVADVANTVSVGAPGNERRITNVAAGIDRTDAANVGQLDDLRTATAEQFNQVNKRVTKSNGGVAMAMALTGSSLPDNKNLGVALNFGAFGGQSAIGISQYMRLNQNVVLSGGIGVQSNQVGGRAGLQVAW